MIFIFIDHGVKEKVAEKLRKSCGKVAGKLWKSCGKVVVYLIENKNSQRFAARGSLVYGGFSDLLQRNFFWGVSSVTHVSRLTQCHF